MRNSIFLLFTLLFSCSSEKIEPIEIISIEEFTSTSRPFECQEIDPENYGQGYTQFIVQNNANDTIKIRSIAPKIMCPIAQNIEYFSTQGVFEQPFNIGFTIVEFPSDFSLNLVSKTIDTFYLCTVKPERFKEVNYKVDFLLEGRHMEQYLNRK